MHAIEYQEDRDGFQFLKAVVAQLPSKGETSSGDLTNSSLSTLDWPSTVAWLGVRIADALSHSHSLGVLHRDIKPDNILLTADGQPMLADFNLSFGSTVVGGSVERAFGGSLAYMSPEHIRVLRGECNADAVNESSNIYSLSAVLYELLTGNRPFSSEEKDSPREPTWTDHLSLRQHGVKRDVPASRGDHGLLDFLQQGLAFSPWERPRSARQVTLRC